jgi:NAD(P)-dependent dehydrogenase (short-subunit alcohol dehydrogenase family)
MRPLEGKVALITGGGTGIGGAIARGMVAAGASVCITGRRGPVLDDMARSLPSGSVLTCAGDISNAAEAERMVATALEFKGALDVLVNNAGVGVHGGVLEIELKDWRRALDVNLTGPFLMMKAALPSMLKAGRGSIINISSIAGLRGTPGTCSYAAAKGGLNMLSQQVAVELGPHNIRCNVVCPGAVRTPQMDESIQGLGKALDSADTSLDAIYGILSANTPLRRVGHVSELVGICNFLASDASTFVTGAVIVVDGGASAVDVNGLTLHQLPPPRSTDGSP